MSTLEKTGLELGIGSIQNARKRLTNLATARGDARAPAPPVASSSALTRPDAVANQVADTINQFTDEVMVQMNATAQRVAAIQQAISTQLETSEAPVYDNVIDVVANEAHDNSTNPSA